MRRTALFLVIALLFSALILGTRAQETPPTEASPSPSPSESPSPAETPAETTPTPSPSPTKAASSKIYVSDSENGRVVIMDDLKATNLQSLGGAGRGPGKFLDPAQVWVDQERFLYIADKGNNRVVMIDMKPEEGLPVWNEFNDLDEPEGVAVWGDEVYIADTGHDEIKIYKGSTKAPPVRTIKEPSMKQPGKLWFDETGRLFITCGEDPPGGQIVMIAQGSEKKPGDWEIYSGAGLRPTGFGPSQALLRGKRILSIDASSNRLTATDNAAGRATREIGTYGSGLGRFMRPEGMALDSQGRIYIADTGNDRIIRIDDPTGAGWVEFEPGRNPNNTLRGPKSIFIWAPSKPKPPESEDDKKKDKKEK